MLRSYSNLDRINIFMIKVSLSRRYWNRVLAPEGELLSFASPRQLLPALLYLLHPCSRKDSNQRKGDPIAAYFLRSLLSPGVARRAILGPLATRWICTASLRAIPAESCGAQRGKRDKNIRA
jgi:hypothetical protein